MERAATLSLSLCPPTLHLHRTDRLVAAGQSELLRLAVCFVFDHKLPPPTSLSPFRKRASRIRKGCGRWGWRAKGRRRENQCGSWKTRGSEDDKLEFLILRPASRLEATRRCITPEQKPLRGIPACWAALVYAEPL